MAHCGSKPKKMKQGGAATGAPRTMSDNDRRILNQMLKREKAARASRERVMRREMGKDNMTQSDMDYIEKGPKFFKNGGCVMSGRGGKFKGIS